MTSAPHAIWRQTLRTWFWKRVLQRCWWWKSCTRQVLTQVRFWAQTPASGLAHWLVQTWKKDWPAGFSVMFELHPPAASPMRQVRQSLYPADAALSCSEQLGSQVSLGQVRQSDGMVIAVW